MEIGFNCSTIIILLFGKIVFKHTHTHTTHEHSVIREFLHSFRTKKKNEITLKTVIHIYLLSVWIQSFVSVLHIFILTIMAIQQCIFLWNDDQIECNPLLIYGFYRVQFGVKTYFRFLGDSFEIRFRYSERTLCAMLLLLICT